MKFSCTLCGSRDWPTDNGCPLCRKDEQETEVEDMEAKYTPGPWETGPQWIVKDRDGTHVCDCSMSYFLGDNEVAANAQLITAAPELLEALEAMIEAWQEQFGEDTRDCMPEPQNQGHVCQCCKARAAIAKAKGETP